MSAGPRQRHHKKRWWLLVLVILVVSAIGGFVVWQQWQTREARRERARMVEEFTETVLLSLRLQRGNPWTTTRECQREAVRISAKLREREIAAQQTGDASMIRAVSVADDAATMLENEPKDQQSAEEKALVAWWRQKEEAAAALQEAAENYLIAPQGKAGNNAEAKDDQAGGDSHGHARLLNIAALARMVTGRYAEADSLFKKAEDLQAQRKTEGGDKDATAIAQAALTQADHADNLIFQMKYEDAENLAEAAALAAADTTAADEKNELLPAARAAALYAQGRAQLRSGLYAKAETTFKDAITLEKSVALTWPEYGALAEWELSKALREQWKTESTEHARRAVELSSARRGPNHPLTMATKVTLASALRAQEETDESTKLIAGVVQVCEKAPVAQQTPLRDALMERAEASRKAGKNKEAQDDAERALSIASEMLGKDSLEAADAWELILKCRLVQDQIDQAKTAADAMLSIRERWLAKSNPKRVVALALKAKYLTRTAVPSQKEAEAYFAQVKEWGEKLGWTQEPWFMQIMADYYGDNLLTQQKWAEAEKLYRQCVEVMEKHWGKGHIETVPFLQRVAVTIGSTGRLPEAEEMLLECLTIQEQKLGPNDEKLLSVLNTLLSSYSVRGAVPEAKKILERIVAVNIHTHGENSLEAANARASQGSLLIQMGDPDAALEPNRLAVEYFSKDESRLSPILPTLYENYATLLVNTKDFKKGLSYYPYAIRAAERIYGEKNWQPGDLRLRYAELLGALVNAEEAVKIAAKGRDAILASQGPNDVLSLTSNIMYAGALDRVSRGKEALGLLDDLAGRLPAILALPGDECEALLHKLSVAYLSRNLPEKALPVLLEVKARQEKAKAPYSVGIAVGMVNLSIAQSMLKKTAEAEANLQIAREILSEPSRRVGYAQLLLNTGAEYRRTRVWVAAETTFEECITVLKTGSTEDKKVAVDMLLTLANCYLEQDKKTEVEPCLQDAVKLAEEVHGPDSVELATCTVELAWFIASNLGKFEEAIPIELQGLKIREQVLGMHHERVAVCAFHLGLMMVHSGRSKDAGRLLQESVNMLAHLPSGEDKAPHPLLKSYGDNFYTWLLDVGMPADKAQAKMKETMTNPLTTVKVSTIVEEIMAKPKEKVAKKK